MVGNLTYFCPSLNIYTSETLIHYLSYVASIFLTGYKVEPKINQEFTYKNCVFILTCLNFSHLQSTLHLMQYTYRDTFFHCSKQFLNSSILIPFSASAVFCFTSTTLAKHFPLRTFFIQGNKKCCSGQDQVNREGEECGS